jgi:hypothetical protein
MTKCIEGSEGEQIRAHGMSLEQRRPVVLTDPCFCPPVIANGQPGLECGGRVPFGAILQGSLVAPRASPSSLGQRFR